MKGSPAVAVVIPLFNKAAFIEQTLRSALTQSYSDFEVIVVDDGSTDDGAMLVGRFDDPRIRIVRQDNAGVSEARNRALNEVRAPLAAFLDADDVWTRDHLRHLIELSRRFPEAGLYGNRFLATAVPQASEVHSKAVTYRLLDDYFVVCASGETPFFTSSCMVPCELARSVGAFPSEESRAEDTSLWIRLAAIAPVAVSDYLGCLYRRSAQSLTTTPVLVPDISMRTLQSLLAKNVSWPAARKHAVSEYYYCLAMANALDCLRAGQREAARRFLELSSGTIGLRRRWFWIRLLAAMPLRLVYLTFYMRDRLRGEIA
jgi:cellulose synthase/poly-beta-1,6-N-acetylglucosamine synthase-like glycosyltransferase